jgi:hypothetical protein
MTDVSPSLRTHAAAPLLDLVITRTRLRRRRRMLPEHFRVARLAGPDQLVQPPTGKR